MTRLKKLQKLRIDLLKEAVASHNVEKYEPEEIYHVRKTSCRGQFDQPWCVGIDGDDPVTMVLSPSMHWDENMGEYGETAQ